MSSLARYAIEGVVIGLVLGAFTLLLGRLMAKPLPSPMNTRPGREWHVSDRTRHRARLQAEQEEL